MPKRHLYTRFARDFKEWYLPQLDFCHFTVPLHSDKNNGFVFPSEYVGQYGVYEATKHVYQSNANLKHLVKDGYILTDQRHFAADIEKGVQNIRANWRAENKISPTAY